MVAYIFNYISVYKLLFIHYMKKYTLLLHIWIFSNQRMYISVCMYVCMYVHVYICKYESVYCIFSYISISLLRPSRSTTPTFSTTSSTLFTSSRKSSSSSSQYTHQRCLLASEVVHLMCLVPTFFDLLDSNKGLITI